MTLVDTSGWLNYFLNGPLIDCYEKELSKPETVLTPTIVLYEVYKKIKIEAGEEQADLAASQMNATTLVPLTESIAYQAADVSIEHKLAMADAIIYATAQEYGAKLVTSAADFKNLPNVSFIPYI